jgi:hypothetical protein
MKTADEYRALCPDYLEHERASSCAYAFMYLDVLWWLTNRTDITLTAKEMVLKSAIITLASIAEAALTIRFRRGFGGDTNFKVRLNNAQQLGLIRALGVSRQTVLQRVKRGELEAIHVTRGRQKGLRIKVIARQSELLEGAS